MTDGPVIEVRRDEAGFVVAVVPADPGYPARHFCDQREAFGAAGGLRMVTGWKRVDLTGER